MGKKLDKTKINSIAASFNETEEWQSTINLRELIENLFEVIDAAKTKKASWEAITERIQNVLGSEEKINPATVRQYYYDALKKQNELPKRKKSKRQTPATNLSKPSQSLETVQPTTEEATEEIIEEVAEELEEDLDTPESKPVEPPETTQQTVDRGRPAQPSPHREGGVWKEPAFNKNRVRPK